MSLWRDVLCCGVSLFDVFGVVVAVALLFGVLCCSVVFGVFSYVVFVSLLCLVCCFVW